MSGLPIFQFIILQLIVLGVVIYFLKRIMYSDTESAVARLNRVYQDLLAKQKDLAQKIEGAEKEYQAKKEESGRVAASLKSQALDEIRQKEDDMLKQARSQAEEIINRAREASDKMRQEIEKELKEKIIDFATELMGVAFRKRIIGAIHRELVKDFLDRGKNLDLSSVGPHINKLVVRSAFPLEEEDLNGIKEVVSLRLNRPMEVETTTDKSLMAGICFQFGTLLVDGSLANALREAQTEVRKKLEQD
ncbi:MAG TPA: F0F1 ATP synthase subunit delta [Candidatus Omnitrophota bacterium]|nr:F0F1 ATP synthase subunit delta [Candidatus Omnitrophota bacterium]